jgi:hypothetical protein
MQQRQGSTNNKAQNSDENQRDVFLKRTTKLHDFFCKCVFISALSFGYFIINRKDEYDNHDGLYTL